MPIPVGPVLSYNSSTYSLFDGINSGVTLVKIGQIASLSTVNTFASSIPTGTLFLGNGTFIVELEAFNFQSFPTLAFSTSRSTIFYQGTDIDLMTSTSAINPTGQDDLSTYLGFGGEIVNVKITKLSNDISGGVNGDGNYGRARQQ
jgi:hypothetical protein